MFKILTNLLSFLLVLFFLNGCSTISDTIDLAGIVDKTEEFFYGEEEEEKKNNEGGIDDEKTLEDELPQSMPKISDIPSEKPEFSDIEKDFFEGEKSNEETQEVSEGDDYRNDQELDRKELTLEQKNMNLISQISQNVRMRVRLLILNSDPPTSNKAKKISYIESTKDKSEYKQEDKIAVFYFPNNSVVPDTKAISVIKEIIKIYKDNSLVLVGHSSSLGGDSPTGKKINMDLSFARADSLKNMLVNNGFSANNISILGKGDMEPSTNAKGNNTESENRRVEVFLFSN